MHKATQVRTKKYKGAHILILNDWQNFRYVIFYKGLFFSTDFTIVKSGEYTNKEFLLAMDGAYQAACATIDIIVKERSIINKLKKLYEKIINRAVSMAQVFRHKTTAGQSEASASVSE